MSDQPQWPRLSWLTFSVYVLAFSGWVNPAWADPLSWVTQDHQGHLLYQTDNRGNRIPDFSHAGYGGGGIALPDVPTQKRVNPSGEDDTSAIQAALDEVAALPLKERFRGAVLLSSGTFHCAKTLTLSQSGVVLRGSGSGENGTIIEMTGPPHLCLQILGHEMKPPVLDPAKGLEILDSYVPVGTQDVTVKDTSGLKKGDRMIIERKLTSEWIHSLGMDTLVRDGKPQTWIKPDQVVTYERTIESIKGRQIHFDLPMPDVIDARLMSPETLKVFKVNPEEPHLSQCGIESLQIHSPPPAGILTAPNHHAILLNNCEDCWIRDVTMNDVLTNVQVLEGSRRITIENVNAFHSATVVGGKGASADFMLRGSQVLLDRSSSTGHGSFFVATAETGSVLNVVLNCHFYGVGGIQPHMRWSTTLLADNCQLPQGKIAYHNRGFAGSGQGWAIAWGVVWNCTASLYKIASPPGALNWCIGCQGGLDKKLGLTEGYVSFGKPVLPQSLYLAQLRDRLGDQALKNMGY